MEPPLFATFIHVSHIAPPTTTRALGFCETGRPFQNETGRKQTMIDMVSYRLLLNPDNRDKGPLLYTGLFPSAALCCKNQVELETWRRCTLMTIYSGTVPKRD